MGGGELGRVAEATVVLVEPLVKLQGGRVDEPAIHVISLACGGLFGELLGYLVGGLDDLVPLFSPDLGQLWYQLGQARPSEPALLREVGAREERTLVGGHDDGQGPTPGAGHHLTDRHVDAVDVGPLLPVHLDVDEGVVHHLGHHRVLEGLVGHHVAPVARGVSDGQEDGLVLATGSLEGLLSPGVPIDRVVRMLKQVRALLIRQAVGPGGLGSSSLGHGAHNRLRGGPGPSRAPGRARMRCGGARCPRVGAPYLPSPA